MCSSHPAYACICGQTHDWQCCSNEQVLQATHTDAFMSSSKQKQDIQWLHKLMADVHGYITRPFQAGMVRNAAAAECTHTMHMNCVSYIHTAQLPFPNASLQCRCAIAPDTIAIALSPSLSRPPQLTICKRCEVTSIAGKQPPSQSLSESLSPTHRLMCCRNALHTTDAISSTSCATAVQVMCSRFQRCQQVPRLA